MDTAADELGTTSRIRREYYDSPRQLATGLSVDAEVFIPEYLCIYSLYEFEGG